MLGREKCLECGRMSPETNGENTLTTSYGWRIRKTIDGAGSPGVEWRCPTCWQRFKAAQQAVGAAAPMTTPPASPHREPHGDGGAGS